jgi:putative transposase
MNPWRAGCGESRTSGSEGGPRNRTEGNLGTAPRSDPYSHFERCKRVAYAIIDVVTRYWIGYLLTTEMTSTQVQVLFHAALEDQGLLDRATGELLGPDGRPLQRDKDAGPILVPWSDNGPEMTSTDTREFMALMAIAQHHGRPGTPTDQAHVESFFSHLKADWPHLTDVRDPAALDSELARVQGDYNSVRLHAGIGYVTPADEHHGRGPAIRRARARGLKRARQELCARSTVSKYRRSPVEGFLVRKLRSQVRQHLP